MIVRETLNRAEAEITWDFLDEVTRVTANDSNTVKLCDGARRPSIEVS